MSKNLLTIEAFAEWAEKQPSEKEYDWLNCSVCACGQYARLLGLSTDQWVDALADDSPFWVSANAVAHTLPRTFGARLRSLSA